MKKVPILIFILLSVQCLSAQIKLTDALFDSLVCKLYGCSCQSDAINFRPILNFASLEEQKRSIFISSTPLTCRKDITEDMMIYLKGECLFFVQFRDIDPDSSLVKKMIPYTDTRFIEVLDSIKFRKDNTIGVYPMRSPLVVYQVRQSFLFKNIFKITSQNYIPYLSAPDIFIPKKKLTNEYLDPNIDVWYYNYLLPVKKLNKKYYDDMKPIRRIILRM